MAGFLIVTDSTADFPKEYLQEHHVACMNLSYMIGGKTYGGETGKDLKYKEFYDKMRSGDMATTSQINPEELKDYFEQYIAEGHNQILYLALSSGLSGTYNSACFAVEVVMEEHPDCKIIVIDSLCASMGEALFVHYGVKMMEEGKSMEETAGWLKENALHFIHIFTVDDLNHLYRGGRVSKAVALLGTLAGIKPILHVDKEGHLVPIDKVRGRKKSLMKLVDYMEEKIGSYKDKNDIIFVSHGDALDDAQCVAEEVKKRFGIETFLINHIGPTVGTHSGPGTIALFFVGEER
ncbi:MAG TPA: DegV family protein [Lachnospiraceae bacterium]|nr:DegV family protein [Lachnospiraceae bacterium]